MPQFNLIDYLLVIIATFSFYPLGSRLGIKPIFTATLVGVSLIGLIVAIFANFCAGLIRPILLITISIGWILILYDLKPLRLNLLKKIKPIYIFLVILGFILVFANSPARVFLDKEGSKTFVKFNDHYSYYSSQSTEMLNAKYFSRLKVANLEPYVWSRYHFFNSATRTSSMGLVRTPGLFTYWIAQTVLTTLVLLSIAEIFLIYYGFKFRNILILLSWLIIGFTFFSESMTWNLATTGMFSIFATVLLLVSVHKGLWRQVLIALLIFGASAFRLLPIAILSIIVLIYYLYKINKTDQTESILNRTHGLIQKIKLKTLDYVTLAIFLAYNASTIFSAQSSPSEEKISLFAQTIFSPGWLSPLSFYKLISFISAKLPYISSKITVFSSMGFFDKVSASPLLTWVFLIVTGLLIILGIISIFKIIFRYFKIARWFLILTILFLLQIKFISMELVSLYMLTALYVLTCLIFIYWINQKENPNNSMLTKTVLFLMIATFALMFFGLPFSLKGPISYITFDIVLWTVLGIYLFIYSYKNWMIVSAVALAVFLMLTLNSSLFSILLLSPNDPHFSKIDITPLVSKDFNRARYVDKQNYMTFFSKDSKIDDVYSAVLGGNYKYSAEHQSFLNNSFVIKDNNAQTK